MSMRISSNQILDAGIQSMDNSLSDAMAWQKKISSGNNYSKASENAYAVSRGVRLEFDEARLSMYKTNQKFGNMHVILEFEKDGINYKIERGRKPNFIKFHINNKELDVKETDDTEGDSKYTQKEIVKIVDPRDVPFLEMFYSIINANFHYIYNIWKSWYNHLNCSSCGKED